MKIFGFEFIKSVKPPERSIKCTHENARCTDPSTGIHYCPDCSNACIYINGKLTVLTFENMHRAETIDMVARKAK